jgi:hypothetical protein
MFAPASFMLGASANGKRLGGDAVDVEEILKRQRLAQDKNKNIVYKAIDFIIADIYLFSILVYGCWIFCGLVWYKYYSDWTWATAYYYTIEAGLSIGFCYPAEKEDGSKLFTIFYVLIGSSVVSGCLGLLASSMVSTKVSLVAAKHGIGAMTYKDENDRITISSVINCIWYHIKYLTGWYTNRSRTMIVSAFIVWMGLGTAYGMVVENWSFITSLYWAITSSSTGGLQSAPCESGENEFTCNMGNMRGSLMGVFMMVGVPLYAAAIGQFAHIAVGRAMARQEEKMLSRPIEDAEFIFAANILSPEGSETLVLGEYILLELMRLGQTNQQQIEAMKKRFYQLDQENRGELNIWDLQQSGRVVPRKLHSIELARRLRSRSIELFANSAVKIRRSASNDMFTLVPPPSESFEVTSAEVELANERRIHTQKSFKKSKSAALDHSKETENEPSTSANTKTSTAVALAVDQDQHNQEQYHQSNHAENAFDYFDYDGNVEDFKFDHAAMYELPVENDKNTFGSSNFDNKSKSIVNSSRNDFAATNAPKSTEQHPTTQEDILESHDLGDLEEGHGDGILKAAISVGHVESKEDEDEDYIPQYYLDSLN